MTASNPYAPPKARVMDAEPTAHGLKHRNVIVMILFTIISLGLYFLIWWFRRRPGLNRLNSPVKVPLWPLLLVIVMYAVQFVVAFLQESGGIDPGVELFASMFQIGVGITMIVQAFRAKNIIEDHAAPAPESGPSFGTEVKLSGLMTFFFSIFYLQWAINKYVIAGHR